MVVHYVYQEPDKSKLCQGDVLCKTGALVEHLKQYHPHYANHTDYKYFLVLTQSCDLVRRVNSPPKSPYITLAAIRPLEEVLRREAAKYQDEWQYETGVIGGKARNNLAMFLASLLDNNKEGYFYLHADYSNDVNIQCNCCAFLRLSVALKVEHYDLCLAAKTAELKEPFQAKLGYLIGHMYSRIGTTEWNSNYPENQVDREASKILQKTFVIYDDTQIKEGVADLSRDNLFEQKTAKEIKEYIDKTKIKSRKQKFLDAALEVLVKKLKPVDGIHSRIANSLKDDADLQATIQRLLNGDGISKDKLYQEMISSFLDRLRHYLSDENMPDKQKWLERILTQLLQDTSIINIMK